MAEKRDEEEQDNQYRAQRLEKLAKLKELGVDPYPYGFAVSASSSELNALYKDLPAGTETQDRVSVAGRIRAIRNSGMFIDLHDSTGKIQVFNHKDKLSAGGLAILRLLDFGDIIGVDGPGAAHAARRVDRQRRRARRAGQGADAAAGEIPRPRRYRDRATASAIST